ncbi:hypothetical protein D3C78_1502030 [compost metagenome]
MPAFITHLDRTHAILDHQRDDLLMQLGQILQLRDVLVVGRNGSDMCHRAGVDADVLFTDAQLLTHFGDRDQLIAFPCCHQRSPCLGTSDRLASVVIDDQTTQDQVDVWVQRLAVIVLHAR